MRIGSLSPSLSGAMPSVAVTIAALLPEDCTSRGSQPSRPKPLTTSSFASAIFLASAGAGV